MRTPMQWSGNRNAGFSDANPQKLYLPAIIDPEYHFGTVNVEAQQANPNSLLWWMKRLIALRKRYQAFGRGSIEFLYPDNRRVLAYIRRYEEETILVVVNLSRLVQYAELNLKEFEGNVPVELFGSAEFPHISDQPFFLTLGPHAFYWFSLEPVAGQQPVHVRTESAPTITAGSLTELVHSRQLERVLPRYLREQRWFRGKARKIRNATVDQALPIGQEANAPQLTFVQVDYVEGDPETYVLPLAIRHSHETNGHTVLCGVRLVNSADD